MASSLVLETALGGLFQGIFQLLVPLLEKKLTFVWGVDADLKKLYKKFLRLQAVLEDAEERQAKEKAVKLWLRELQALAYDVEDVLDKMKTELLRLQVEDLHIQTGETHTWSRFSSFRVGKLLGPVENLPFRYDIASRIKKILDTMEEIDKDRHALLLMEGGWGRRQEAKDRPLLSSLSYLMEESHIFGRLEDKDNLVSMLLSGDSSGRNISIMSIVGMGGIGKTTLAKLVYNDGRVAEHFQPRIWVCVSEDFDVKRLTKEAVESITYDEPPNVTVDPLHRGLKELINGRRFLLVLDDVWNENYDRWQLLLAHFRAASRGSVIIVTTRSEIVSHIIGSTFTYRLKGLSDEDCLAIFKERAQGKMQGEELERRIISKCKGLPLAAKALGGLLRTVKEHNWERLLKSKIWELIEQKDDMFATLKLSYHHLPAHLKRCFAYCSIFPADHKFDKEEIVLLWMAEGFIQAQGSKQLEDIGREYFEDLVQRSFFQAQDSHYTMHDVIHSLAESFAGEVCFRLVEDSEFYSHTEMARHSSLIYKNLEPGIFEPFYEAKSLRTFLSLQHVKDCNMKEVLYDMFQKLRFLRVLDLNNFNINELPTTVANLKHLRYLNLSYTSLRGLPDAVCSLHNLQTLRLKGCKQIQELPQNFSNLINLRHFDLEGVPRLDCMPPHMGRLTNLQSLAYYVVGIVGGCGIAELQGLVNIRGKLLILNVNNVERIEEARSANLSSKKHLEDLILKWECGHHPRLHDEEVLEALQPNTNLRNLIIENYGGKRFPLWMGESSFTNLWSMHLFNCAQCEFLPPLGQLPHLEFLHIERMPILRKIGPDFYSSSSGRAFMSLKTLLFQDLPCLEEWTNAQNGDFDGLNELLIWDCLKLKELPLLSQSLMKLNVYNCKNLTALPKLESLQFLELNSCNEQVLLTSLPNLTSLLYLKLSEFHGIISLEDGLLRPLTALKKLEICDCDELTTFLSDLPADLNKLHVSNCRKLICLPNNIHELESLEYLSVSGCPLLDCFPRERVPSSLKHLQLQGCPLQSKCSKKEA